MHARSDIPAVPSPLFATLFAAACLAASTPLETARHVTGRESGSPALLPAPANTPRAMIPADVLRVIDGDTVEMRALVWLDLHMTTRVRLKDLDAPERQGRCPQETQLAAAAAARLAQLLDGQRLFLTDLTRDKYGGRVVARIITQGGLDVGQELLTEGLARPYAGSRKRGWCG
jgi:micrococcal nuclease